MKVETIKINHIEYPKKLKKKTVAELLYILKDANEVVRANPEGEKSGYYQDEVNYVCMELNRRTK